MELGKRAVLQSLSFGRRVAEEEAESLASYFIRTGEANKFLKDEIDIVYGPKGSGKSALYVYCLSRAAEFAQRGILIVGAEEPRGAPAFRELAQTKPIPSEVNLKRLWSLYFLQLIGQAFRDGGVGSQAALAIISHLEGAELLPRDRSLASFLRAALRYLRRFTSISSVEGGVEVDPVTGLPKGVTGKISFSEPSEKEKVAGIRSLSTLFNLAEEALAHSRKKVWILLDRLDVAFAESPTLEAEGLRALFHLYVDLQPLEHILLKLFLRSDIWARITSAGFREASHITRHQTITWDRMSLANLIVRRALQSEELCRYYSLTPSRVLQDSEAQSKLLRQILQQDSAGSAGGQDVFDWMLLRVQDGTRQPAPRELIHLFSEGRARQLHLLDLGAAEPPGVQLITQRALGDALQEVSQVRLNQTLYSEYPSLRSFIEKLRDGPSAHTYQSLEATWQMSHENAGSVAFELVEVGFFERQGTQQSPTFLIPLLYGSALGLSSG